MTENLLHHVNQLVNFSSI